MHHRRSLKAHPPVDPGGLVGDTMPAPLTHITPNTPMGANLLPDGSGATFRVWAPRALRVHLISEHSDWKPKIENLLTHDANGYWAGFKDGSRYKFHVFGHKVRGRRLKRRIQR